MGVSASDGEGEAGSVAPGWPARRPAMELSAEDVALLARLTPTGRAAIEAVARHVRSHCDRPYDESDALLFALGVDLEVM